MIGIGCGANPRNAAFTEILNAAKVPPGQRKRWFRQLADLERWELAAVFYLMYDGHQSLEAAMDGMEDVQLHEGSLEEAARELFDSCYLYQLPEFVRSYIDYEQFAYDCRIGGDLREFNHGGTVWTCTNVY